ncbi:MAG: M23 family metallopeptidase [Armatimonadetes bacterium]|nr:M23 family metallopeptidase [Armatimonadota bacterium]
MRSSARLWGGAVAAIFLLTVFASDAWADKPGSGRPSYTVVVIREGQTLWSLSRAYGVSIETIVELNGLDSPDALRVGQRLKIPLRGAPRIQKTIQKPARPSDSTSYTYIVVREGHTVWSISQAYGVSVELIAEINGLRNPDAIRAGMRLRIPVRGASRVQRTSPPRSSGKPPAIVSRHQFVWPARGELTSRFGWRRRARRHHAGIDIGAPWGSPIVAARPGVVIYSGWYFLYGRTVILDHGSGITTLYAHASKLLVRAGQQVAAGQVVAKVGCTGRCTGPHLHFEIRVNGRALNPLSVSLVDSLPAPTPQAAKPAALNLTAQAASLETVVRSTMVVQGPNGQIVQTIEETLRSGQVVRRVEYTTSVESGQVVRVRKTYELVNGTLTLTRESREIVGNVTTTE